MASPTRRSTTLKGSKAAPGPSKASANRAANIGAYQAGKNYTAKGVDRSGTKPMVPKAKLPVAVKRGPLQGAADRVTTGLDALRKRR